MMIEILTYGIICNIAYFGLFFYFVEKIFELTITRKKYYQFVFLLSIPYFVLACISLSHLYFDFNDFIITVVGLTGWIYLFTVRQICLVKLTSASHKQAVVYQLMTFFITLIRFAIEDIFLYFIQTYILIFILELLLSFVVKMIGFYFCGYFTNLLYKNVGVALFRKRDIVLFILLSLFWGMIIDGNIVILIVSDIINIVFVYYFMWRISQNFEFKQMKDIEEMQIKTIKEDYQKHMNEIEQLSKIRHHQKNHFLIFKSLYQKDEEKALEYLNEWYLDTNNKLKECE